MDNPVSSNAGIAQLVERDLAKVEVESSSLFSRSKLNRREASWLPFLVCALMSWRHEPVDNAPAMMCRPGGGIGRRSGLKIRRLHGRTGSSPVLGTKRNGIVTGERVM
jgi:hypothetical protein